MQTQVYYSQLYQHKLRYNDVTVAESLIIDNMYNKIPKKKHTQGVYCVKCKNVSKHTWK